MSLSSLILRHTAIPLILHREHRGEALRYRRHFTESQWWPLHKLRELQWEKLQRLLRHAHTTVPYYQNLFAEHGLTPRSFTDFDDLRKIPVLDRDLIRKHREDLISREYDKAQLQEFGTGGTTRRRMMLYRDHTSNNIKAGAAWRFESFMGRHIGDKLCYFWPYHGDFSPRIKLRTKIKDRYLLRELMFYAGAPSEQSLEHFYSTLKRFRPQFLKVFPNALYAFAKHVIANGYSIPDIKCIMTTGEALEQHHREVFTQAFDAEIYNMYGSREVGNSACECEYHQGLHVAMETSYIEVIADNQPVDDDTEGEFIITDLTNYGFPLIRYAVEDFGRRLSGQCACGRHLQRLSPGIGRMMDMYIAPDGGRHSALALSAYISEQGPPMGQFQYIQKSLCEYHIKITDDPPVTKEITDHVTSVFHYLISPDIKLTFEAVDALPRESSGKIRYFICEADGSAHHGND